jgi:hypothetical protein
VDEKENLWAGSSCWSGREAGRARRNGTRSFSDTEFGLYTTERWPGIYAEHAHAHAEQIRRLRAAIKSG